MKRFARRIRVIENTDGSLYRVLRRLSYGVGLWTLAAFMPLTLPATDGGTVPIKTVAPRFKTLKIVGDALLISDQFRLGKISSSGPDVVTNWTTNLTFRVGETVRQQGGQSNEYWEILAITNGMAKMHYFGFAKGIGGFDEVVWMRESDPPKPPPLVPSGASPLSFLTIEARVGVTYEIGVYVVQQGDNLLGITKRHDLRSVKELKELNPELAGKPILVGQQLRIYERLKN